MFKLYSSQGKRILDYASFGKKRLFQEFWALQDISFSIPKGSTFGILGQNGSGKSTLLSILAGVLEPTQGSYTVAGKVSAILELGAGFHPEFTGRANAYMYGSIMGLSKEDISDRISDIIQFSELSDFIDQPIRTYSSGMNARLAFSVAVNVNAEILIIDEALAVGDALFQHRCFRKIHELKESGKTILYVGHDTEAIRSLCDTAMILDGGCLLDIGDSSTIANKYLAMISEREQKYFEGNLQEYGEKPDETWDTIYNFIDHLTDARTVLTSPDNIREMNIELKNITRKTVLAHPPSKIIYTIDIKIKCLLSFAIGIYPSAYDNISNGVRFSIMIQDTEIFTRILSPQETKTDRGWHNYIIDLSEYEGKRIKISFLTDCVGSDIRYCWSGWGWIKLVSPQLLQSNQLISKFTIRTGTRRVEIIDTRIFNEKKELISSINYGENFYVVLTIQGNENIFERITIGTTLRNKYGTITGTNTLWNKCDLYQIMKNERKRIVFKYQGILNSGLYFITPAVAIADDNSCEIERLDRHEDELSINILSNEKFEGLVNLSKGIEIIDI